jgi:beta-lactamase class A
VRRLVGLLVMLAVLGACSDDKKGAATTTTTTSTTVETIRSEPLRQRIDDVLEYINGGVGVAGELFAPSFLASVSEDQVRQIAEQLRPTGPYEVIAVTSQTAQGAELRVRGTVTMTMSIAIEPDAPHRIVGLLLKPVPVEAASWDELADRLRAAAPEVAFLAAEIVDGQCEPVHAIEADRVMPLGSAFKLYVLGSLAQQVRAGAVSWDDQVEMRDELRVHSSATYGETPPGTKNRLQDLATAMISVSDNTATDLVLLHVGRDAVEGALGALGMKDPARNVPFLTTRELTLLKWGVSTEVRDEYVNADADRRRAMLTELPEHGATEASLAGADLSTPALIDDLEWFASASDLCRVHVALQHLAAEDGLAPVRAILSVNPGVPLDETTWRYVAFKGGSEPGVLAGSWLAERADGRRFFVAALFENVRESVETAALGDAAGAFSLLAKQ